MGARQQLIAGELQLFMNAYPNAAAISANLPGALAQLTANLGNAGIAYQQNAQSRANNPGVNGLQVGELIDMLHTLNTVQAPAFQANRFWDKLVKMHEIMNEHHC
jgi:hypothetical protein